MIGCLGIVCLVWQSLKVFEFPWLIQIVWFISVLICPVRLWSHSDLQKQNKDWKYDLVKCLKLVFVSWDIRIKSIVPDHKLSCNHISKAEIIIYSQVWSGAAVLRLPGCLPTFGGDLSVCPSITSCSFPIPHQVRGGTKAKEKQEKEERRAKRKERKQERQMK